MYGCCRICDLRRSTTGRAVTVEEQQVPFLLDKDLRILSSCVLRLKVHRHLCLPRSMESRDAWLLTLSIVSAFLLLFVTSASADESDPDWWDLAAVKGDQISFYKNDTPIRNSAVANIWRIYAIAYNSANRTLYMSGKNENGNVLSSCNLDEQNLIAQPLPLCEKPDPLGSEIWEIAFDPMTDTLFWLDYSQNVLFKTNAASEGSSCTEVIRAIDFGGTFPVHITLDICNRFIYWMYYASPTDPETKVARARLDGTDRKDISSETGWLSITALAVDNYARKLYIAGTVLVLEINMIKESNLDGTDRRVLVDDFATGYFPSQLYLAVDDTAVYWTDYVSETIWKVYKNGSARHMVGNSDGILLTPGNPDCEIGARSDGFSTLPGVDPMVIVLP